jgi:hypothetical protein
MIDIQSVISVTVTMSGGAIHINLLLLTPVCLFGKLVYTYRLGH